MSDLLNKEEKEELLQRRMEEMKRKNDAIRKRQEEIEAEKRMLGDAAAAPKLVLSKENVIVPEFKDEWESREEEQYESRLSSGGNAWPSRQNAHSQHRQHREERNNQQSQNSRQQHMQSSQTEESWEDDSTPQASPSTHGGFQSSPTAPHQTNNRTKYTNRAGPGSAPAGRGRGRGKPPPTESYDEKRKANARAYEQEQSMKQQSNFLSDPRREGQTGQQTTNQDRRAANQTNNQPQRHPRNFGGGDLREKIKQQRHNNPVSGPPELTMTGKERDNYQKWKKDRDAIDQERLERSKRQTGEWKREWDMEKSNKGELPPQMSLYQHMDERKRSPLKSTQTSDPMKDVNTGKGSAPGGGRGRGRGKLQQSGARRNSGGDDRTVKEAGDKMKITIPNNSSNQITNQTGTKSPRKQSGRSSWKPSNKSQDQEQTTNNFKKYNQDRETQSSYKQSQGKTTSNSNKYTQEKTTSGSNRYNKQDKITPTSPNKVYEQSSAKPAHNEDYKSKRPETAPSNTAKSPQRSNASYYYYGYRQSYKPKPKQTKATDEDDEWKTDEEGWVTDDEEEVTGDDDDSTEPQKSKPSISNKSNHEGTETTEHTESSKQVDTDITLAAEKVASLIDSTKQPENPKTVELAESSGSPNIVQKEEQRKFQAEDEKTPICSKESTPVPQSKESTPVPEGVVIPKMSDKTESGDEVELENGTEAHHKPTLSKLHIDIRDPVEEEDDRPDYLRTPEGGWGDNWSEMM